MVLYFCSRCGYNNINKTKFLNHLQRKNICKSILTNESIHEIKEKYFLTNILIPNNSILIPNDSKIIQNDSKIIQNNLNLCKFCKKTYSTKSNLTKHAKKCKEKNNKINQLENTNILIKKDLENEKKKLLFYKNNNKINNNNNNNSSNSNNNIINNIKNNITINTFGEENLDFLPKKYITDILQIPFYAITKLITDIHFNDKYPENKNIRIKNKTHKFLEIFNNNKWELQNKKQTIEDLIENIYYILNENYEKEYKNIPPKIQNIFNNFKQMYKNKKTKEKIDESAELVILNNS